MNQGRLQPAMPDQVLCKQNQRRILEQRQVTFGRNTYRTRFITRRCSSLKAKWMAERAYHIEAESARACTQDDQQVGNERMLRLFLGGLSLGRVRVRVRVQDRLG